MIVHVHGGNVGLTEALAAHVERSVRHALDRFEQRIDQVSVSLKDINGTRRGEDKCCQVVVDIRRRGTVVIDQVHTDLYAAIDLAMNRTKRTVNRKVERIRTAHRQQARRQSFDRFPEGRVLDDFASDMM